MDNARILLVDDEADILASLKRVLRPRKYEVDTAGNGEEALQKLATSPYDIIVSDLNMPGMTGIELLSRVANDYPEMIRIMLTAYSDAEHVLGAINEGKVWGYMQKPWKNEELLITLEQALQTQTIIAERNMLRRTVDRIKVRKRKQFHGFVGDSVVMQFVYQAIEKCAPSQAPVFITGPSGSGKEVAAEAIHRLSRRADGPYYAINCAAIPSELMESEIFGHVKGAFSGAVSHRDGLAFLADGGTLFLDELGEMDINLQAKLLRFIQTGTFSKVGSEKTEKVDIRFISATNRDPLEAIGEKKLREDLYYRLNVISLDLPPLNERDNDPMQLAHHFLSQFSQQEERIYAGFSPDAEALISQYDWPGNVRQLRNTMHSAVVMSEGPVISADVLKMQLKLDKQTFQQLSVKRRAPAPDILLNESQGDPGKQESDSPTQIAPLAKVERMAIEHAIDHYDDNVVKAASALEVSPSTLYRKIQQWQDS